MGQEGTESESVGKPWGMMKWAHLHYRKYVFKAAIIPLGFGSCFRYPVNLLFFFFFPNHNIQNKFGIGYIINTHRK